MNLIDWPNVLRNALWILGLSSALAAWSYTSWWAGIQGQRMRDAVSRPSFGVPFSAGLLLFSASLAWGATSGWERVLWAALGLAFAWQVVAGMRSARRLPASDAAASAAAAVQVDAGIAPTGGAEDGTPGSQGS